jgi:hypothetical protein
MKQPLGGEARRFVRLARKEIDKSRDQLVKILDPKAATLEEAMKGERIRKLFELGQTRFLEEIRVMRRAIDQADCCSVIISEVSPRNFIMTMSIPMMHGHPLVHEPGTVRIDAIELRGSRKRRGLRRGIVGAITAHALGRMAERTDLRPEDAPDIIFSAGLGSLFLIMMNRRIERSIAMRIINSKEGPEDDVFLVGTLRFRFNGSKKVVFADWRTLMTREWLSKDLAYFGDMLTDTIKTVAREGDGLMERLDQLDKLPVVPVREDYIQKLQAERGNDDTSMDDPAQ